MQFKNTVKHTMIAAASAITLFTMNACDEMKDDLDECPQGLYVEFVYDYNVERADMFNDHVGSVTLYVYDNEGRLVRTQTEENTATTQPLRDKNYRMTVEGLPAGEYRLLALANQRPYNQIAKDNGIRYIRTEGQKQQDLRVDLQELPAATAVEKPVYQQQLDTLWHGTLRSVDYGNTPITRAEQTAKTVTVKTGAFTHCTMSLVRDTKRLHVAIHQAVNRADCDIKDYEVYITDVNGRILYDNTVDTQNQPMITYRPFDEWNTYYDNVMGTSSYTVPEHDYEMTAHADLDFNRRHKSRGSRLPLSHSPLLWQGSAPHQPARIPGTRPWRLRAFSILCTRVSRPCLRLSPRLHPRWRGVEVHIAPYPHPAMGNALAERKSGVSH